MCLSVSFVLLRSRVLPSPETRRGGAARACSVSRAAPRPAVRFHVVENGGEKNGQPWPYFGLFFFRRVPTLGEMDVPLEEVAAANLDLARKLLLGTF